MAGLSPTGLTIKRLPEVVEGLKEEARQIFADVTPPGEVTNTEDNSALGRMIGVVSPSDSDIWEAIQQVYDAFVVNSATGVALDNLVALGGISRFPESATRANILVEGTINLLIAGASSKVSSATTGKTYTIPAGIALTPSQASGIGIVVTNVQSSTQYTISYLGSGDVTPTDITITSGVGATQASIFALFETEIVNNHPLFSTLQKDGRLFILNVDPFQLVNFTVGTGIGIEKILKTSICICDETGPIEQEANTITTIATPLFGWDSVTNPSAASAGSLTETDEELRERFRNTKFQRATNTIESLYSAIFALAGVTDFVIYENDTNITDVNGVPGHSFLPIVNGGLGSEIAQAIWDNKPIGILSFGNSTVTVLDSRGFPHDVSFSRPNAVNLYIDIGLTTFADFPADGEDQIKDAIVASLDGLGIGEDVIYTRLYTPINSVPGHQVDSLTIGTAPSPVGMSNIVVPFDGIAQILKVNINFV